MSYLDTKIYIEANVKDYMTANLPTWKIKFPLVNFPKSESPRVEIMVTDGVGFRTNIGTIYHERIPGSSFVDVSVSTEDKRGTSEIIGAVEGIRKLLQQRNVRLLTSNSRLIFGMAYATNLGDIGNRYHYRITQPYVRHEPGRVAADLSFG
jgi:hypothetical protein